MILKRLYLIIPVLALLTSCGQPANESPNNNKQLAPGTLIDSVCIPVHDPLNKFNFTVALKVDSPVEKGAYRVDVVYGKGAASGGFLMPKGCEKFLPSIRKTADSNTVMIGFKVGKDTTFYEYYRVEGARLAIQMGYIKTYSFE